MYSSYIIFLLVIYFIVVNIISKEVEVAEKSKKVAKVVNRIIAFSPIVGVLVFTILFAFVLKSRLAERISHSILVFGLWMYATKFYVNIISYFKSVKVLIMSALGMCISVALAIVYTPLDRYTDLIFVQIGQWSIVMGGIILLIYYVVVLLTKEK